MLDILKGIGIIGIVLIVILIPFVATVVLGVYIAGALGLTGIVWWAFVILFYLVVMGLLGALNRLGNEQL